MRGHVRDAANEQAQASATSYYSSFLIVFIVTALPTSTFILTHSNTYILLHITYASAT